MLTRNLSLSQERKSFGAKNKITPYSPEIPKIRDCRQWQQHQLKEKVSPEQSFFFGRMAKLGQRPAQHTAYIHRRYSNTIFHSSCHLPTRLQARVPSSIKWKSYPVELFLTSNKTMNVKCFAQSLAHRNPHPPAEQQLLRILTSTRRALPDPHQHQVPWGRRGASHLKPLPASEAGFLNLLFTDVLSGSGKQQTLSKYCRLEEWRLAGQRH